MTPDGRPRTVAAFDFDGTLSTRDNFVPFLRRVAGTAAVSRSMAVNSTRIVTRPRAQRSRDALKALVLHDLFAGADAASLDEIGRGFAFEVTHRHLRAEMVQRADWHRTQGHTLVIVSASLGVYLRPIAEQLRFDHVLCTELEVGDDGYLTGAMQGANVRGLEKARRLDALLATQPFGHGAGQPFGHGAGQPFGHGAGQPFGHGAGQPFGHGAGQPFGHGAGQPFGHGAGQPAYVWAYGDSSGDRHLWERADRAVRVGKRRIGPR